MTSDMMHQSYSDLIVVNRLFTYDYLIDAVGDCFSADIT